VHSPFLIKQKQTKDEAEDPTYILCSVIHHILSLSQLFLTFPTNPFHHFIKMSEIVLADPVIEPQRTDRALVIYHAAAASSSSGGGGTGPEPFDSERLPPSLSREIQMFLRVANLIESEEPRIAYLCKPFGSLYYTF
jgi:hypothetical protein